MIESENTLKQIVLRILRWNYRCSKTWNRTKIRNGWFLSFYSFNKFRIVFPDAHDGDGVHQGQARVHHEAEDLLCTQPWIPGDQLDRSKFQSEQKGILYEINNVYQLDFKIISGNKGGRGNFQ